MKTFDPDDDAPGREPDEDAGIQLDADLVDIDVDRALALLDRITAHLPGGGENRDGQREMVAAVARAFTRHEHAVIEAGTGVGKSLAYLVPAAMSAQRVVIATATKNLQDQLASKDAPTVAAVSSRTRVAVLKGKSNYLCRNRAQATGAGAQLSFDDGTSVPRGVADQMRRVLRWAEETTTGDRDELSFELDPRAWRGLSVTPQECLGRAQCPQGHNCFHELAKDRAAESDIVIVNTHLYAAHLASGAMLLPPHDYVVFDEAHEVLDIFSSLLGTSLNATRLRAFATVAKSLVGPQFAETAADLSASAERLATILEIQYDARDLSGLGPDAQREVDTASALVTRLLESLRSLPTTGADDEARKIRALGPGVHLANDLARVAHPSPGEVLYLARRDKEVDLEVNLVDVGPRLRDELWANVTAILTSATIPENLPAQLGLADVRIETFASPFDYAHHSLLYVPAGFPSRNEANAEGAIIDELVTLITAAGGRTLALFTNRAVMNRVAEAVEARLATTVLVQGTLSRQRIIELFRDSAEASLFAVTSFWQGIDVPGHSLSLVTIDRLPFSVPNDPLVKARQERASNPFFEVDLPRATMLLAQGVGRLIRNRDDRGVVAVLDTRLAEARYRALLFKKLPPMKRTRDQVEVTTFLRALRERTPDAD